VHDAIPDVASLPPKLTPTLVLYHPLAFGALAAVPVTPVGAVSSILMAGTVFLMIVVPSDHSAVHVSVSPLVSPGTRTAGSQPVVLISPWVGLTVQRTVTSLRTSRCRRPCRRGCT
jgi:hypothetical protein